MIGQRVRMLRQDGPLQEGWEGVVESHYGRGNAWDVRWDNSPKHCIPTYDKWFTSIASEPDETEGFFV